MTDEPSVASLPSGNGATAPTPPTPDTLTAITQLIAAKAAGCERMASGYRQGNYAETGAGVELQAIHRAEADYYANLATGLRWLAGSLSEMMAAQAQNLALRERLKLVDHVCHSHHAASLVTWEGSCPVCAEAGGVEFYVQNAKLYRGAPPEPSA